MRCRFVLDLHVQLNRRLFRAHARQSRRRGALIGAFECGGEDQREIEVARRNGARVSIATQRITGAETARKRALERGDDSLSRFLSRLLP